MDQRNSIVRFPDLGEMMERLALNPVAALQSEPAALGTIIQRCQACPADAVCGDWLAAGRRENQGGAGVLPERQIVLTLRAARPPADVGRWL